MTHEPSAFASRYAVLSGILSYLAVSPVPVLLPELPMLVDELLFYSPGALFGLFVLVPVAWNEPRRLVRAPLLVLASTLAYFAATQVALTISDESSLIAACAIAGMLGAVLVAFATHAITGRRFSSPELTRTMVLGASGGMLIGCGMHFEEMAGLFLFGGFVAWHWGVSVGLFAPGEPETTTRRRLVHAPVSGPGPGSARVTPLRTASPRCVRPAGALRVLAGPGSSS